MQRLFVWLIVLGGLYFAYQAGMFNSIINYFAESAEMAKKEQVIQNPDGSYSTVRYRNVFDLLLNK